MNGEPVTIASNGNVEPARPPPPVLGRRNLPRASQACQMCRAKKARCDQQDPCSNCVRHSFTCEYAPKTTQRSGTRKPSDAQQQRGDGGATDLVHQSSISVDEDVDEAPPGGDGAEKEDEAPAVLDEDANLGAQPDTVGDVNKHTSGTEYYGSSSNFSLLNQLFAHARSHASARAGRESSNGDSPLAVSGTSISLGDVEREPLYSESVSGRGETPLLRHLSTNPLSIVNLLYNEESGLPPSRPKSPIAASEKIHQAAQVPSPSSSGQRPSEDVSTRPADSTIPGFLANERSHYLTKHAKHPLESSREDAATIRLAETLLEKEYVRLFFHNLHHLHPLLVLGSFTARCEKEIWNKGPLVKPRKDLMQFLALYNIVVAVGALVAGTDTLKSFEHELGLAAKRRKLKNSKDVYSSVTLSRAYFRKSRSLLGDVFEVCSLESAQTLFLMSLYCQNALKPHACYMYSGMAVRTALAIGLPSESMSRSVAARKAARRTWWVIYSQEMDMCCSSGRIDSLRKPHNYQIPFPRIRGLSNAPAAELEDESLSMINVMVDFAVILRRASKEIYLDSKGLSLAERSKVALGLDEILDDWRANLPPWLNLDSVSFREAEWASKQKLVLQLRYLNARILFHRPFLASYASTSTSTAFPSPSSDPTATNTTTATSQFTTFQPNISLCLSAARATIDLFFESYAHRHYFRTWWYNTTYTLYAGMIILYLILLNYPAAANIDPADLIRDVEKSLEILRSMEEAAVARRSADLVQELLDVARQYLAERKNLERDLGGGENGGDNAQFAPSSMNLPIAGDAHNAGLDNYNNTSSTSLNENALLPSMATTPPGTTPNLDATSSSTPSFWDTTQFMNLFPPSGPSQQNRTDLLATLVDPTILEEFAGAGGEEYFFGGGGGGGFGGFGLDHLMVDPFEGLGSGRGRGGFDGNNVQSGTRADEGMQWSNNAGDQGGTGTEPGQSPAGYRYQSSVQ